MKESPNVEEKERHKGREKDIKRERKREKERKKEREKEREKDEDWLMSENVINVSNKWRPGDSG